MYIELYILYIVCIIILSVGNVLVFFV